MDHAFVWYGERSLMDCRISKRDPRSNISVMSGSISRGNGIGLSLFMLGKMEHRIAGGPQVPPITGA